MKSLHENLELLRQEQYVLTDASDAIGVLSASARAVFLAHLDAGTNLEPAGREVFYAVTQCEDIATENTLRQGVVARDLQETEAKLDQAKAKLRLQIDYARILCIESLLVKEPKRLTNTELPEYDQHIINAESLRINSIKPEKYNY